MKLRNAAAPQWKHSWHSSYSRYWEIDDKRDNSRPRFETILNSQGDIWYPFEPETEMINAKLFWNAFTMCPRKKN